METDDEYQFETQMAQIYYGPAEVAAIQRDDGIPVAD
jgi:hypothetical protein